MLEPNLWNLREPIRGADQDTGDCCDSVCVPSATDRREESALEVAGGVF